MTFYTGTQTEVLFANGFAYPAANASASTAQNLLAGASGKYQQPLFPGGFFQQGRTGQVATVDFSCILAGHGDPDRDVHRRAGHHARARSPAVPTLVACTAFPRTSSGPGGTVHGHIDISNWGSGYGTSSVATNLWSTISLIVNNGSTPGGYRGGRPDAAGDHRLLGEPVVVPDGDVHHVQRPATPARSSKSSFSA